MTRTEASRRPCTFGNAAGIHVFTASVFMSFVTRPLRNITASEPLTKKRPRSEESIRPAPPSRTAEYSDDVLASLIEDLFALAKAQPVSFRGRTCPPSSAGQVPRLNGDDYELLAPQPGNPATAPLRCGW